MKVKFIPQNVEFEIATGQSVMKLAHEQGLPIRSICNGMPSCTECRVKVVKGENNLMPPSPKEVSLIGTGHFIDHRRLSCQMQCFGDIVVDLSEQIEKEQNSSYKKPQGALKSGYQPTKSLAVTGNLIDEAKDLLQETDVGDDDDGDSGNQSLMNEVTTFIAKNQTPGKESKNKREHNRNKNRGHNKKRGQEKKQGPEQEQRQSKSHKNRSNRNKSYSQKLQGNQNQVHGKHSHRTKKN